MDDLRSKKGMSVPEQTEAYSPSEEPSYLRHPLDRRLAWLEEDLAMLHRRVRQECSAVTAMSMRGGSPGTGDATDSDLRQMVARLEDELAAERTARRLMEDELAVECNARETLAGRVNVLEATLKRMKEMQVKKEDDVNATCSTTPVAAQPSTPAASSPKASVVRIASPTAPIPLAHWTSIGQTFRGWLACLSRGCL
eukprot:s272_g22.t1